MKIIKKDIVKKNFEDLSVGDTFRYYDEIYMVTRRCCSQDGEMFNCVNLGSGYMCLVLKNIEVEVPDIHVVIE